MASLHDEESRQRRFIEKLPKVELHAHLNGSISQQTIQRLIVLRRQRDPSWNSSCENATLESRSKTLADCFAVFSLLHDLVDNEEAASIVTNDVIREFAQDDNVKYIELRTTPRAMPATGMTKESYVRAVLSAMRKSEEDITVRLLLAIDRRTSIEDAADTLEMADRLRKETNGLVIGLDLSGDPTKPAEKFIPILKEAKKRGLKLALHIAEVNNMTDESRALLSVPPDRIGHGVFLHPDHGGNAQLLRLTHGPKIPIEICLTSNVTSGTVKVIQDHCFSQWRLIGHPCILCTDDKGVFSTSLNEEYILAAKEFHLSFEELWDLSLQSIDSIFESKEFKTELKAKFLSAKERCFS
ncbi:hypothetical protein CAPTEDRAFT_219075 [Capitella teleta]|uniref:Adenosine deaminase domain-containing protein n=1 Tax=Capitella teleta TaxID=283909 RepID=R7V3B8_CAPTE|nr:hypothetical protein CAPTEDRAFT_219075 [Capitella teleta]|eukprot:ELU13338.1 hypothetical protein CAPTEDRAFT_219075 [Capitella teleta]